MASSYPNYEPDTYITVEPVYKTGRHRDHDEKVSQNPNILFDFNIIYTNTYESDSDSDEDEDLEKLDSETCHHKTLEFDKNWLIGGNKARIQANVYHILEMIDVPYYREIIKDFTQAILDLKKLDVISMEKVKMEIHVVTIVLLSSDDDYDEDDDEDDDDDDDDDYNDEMDITLAVAPASDEAVANHLVTVVVENDEEHKCMICLDKIRVKLDIAVARMPCKHVFHRTCGEGMASA